MKSYKITVIRGDGVGPEVIDEAIKVLDAVSHIKGFELQYEEALMGGIAYDIKGEPLPKETVEKAKSSDAVLFGAIGGEKWDFLPKNYGQKLVYWSLEKRLAYMQI
jgi:3-isopropylmalate dehydrogenase